MNVKVPSPILEELIAQSNNETHAQASEYRAMMLGTPQQ